MPTDTHLPTAWLAPPQGLLPSNHPIKVSAAPIAISATIAFFIVAIVTILFNLKGREVFLEDNIVDTEEMTPSLTPSPSMQRGRTSTREFIKRKISFKSKGKSRPRLQISEPVLISPLTEAAINAVPIRPQGALTIRPQFSPQLPLNPPVLSRSPPQPISPHLPSNSSRTPSVARTHTTGPSSIQAASSLSKEWNTDHSTLAGTQAWPALFTPSRSEVSTASTKVEKDQNGRKRYAYDKTSWASQVSGETYDLASKTGLGDPY